MTLDRAWARRPIVSAPLWGRSVPDIWADTPVTFIRNEPVENPLGGFSDSGDVEYGPVDASVSIDTDVPLRTGSDELRGAAAAGPVRRRMYLVIIEPTKFDATPNYTPRKGDRMRFQDPRSGSQVITTNVQSATMPLGIGDHWELESEAFE